METEIKTIVVNLFREQKPKDNNNVDDPIKKRVITATEKWPVQVLDQKALIQNMNKDSTNDMATLIRQQIQGKLGGYRQQDLKKGLYLENQFVDVARVLALLQECELACFYCKCSVQVLYERVREPRQWSLDRIDNSLGHIVNNVIIACLDCNLRRKTMYHERFAFTKQLTISRTHQET